MSASISLLLINLTNFLSKVSPLVQILGYTVALSSGVDPSTPRSVSHHHGALHRSLADLTCFAFVRMVGSNIVHVRWHDRSSGRLLTGVARREKICRICKPCLRPEDEISQFLAPAWQGYMYPGLWPLCLRHRLMSRAPSCYKIERTGVVGGSFEGAGSSRCHKAAKP